MPVTIEDDRAARALAPITRLKVLKNVSVSQVETHSKCERKWFFKSIAGLEDPETPSKERGKRIHKAAEETAQTGIIPRVTTPKGLSIEDPYVSALKPWIPKKEEIDSRRAMVEFPIRLDTGLGIPWIGYVDAMWSERSPIEILDYKTTSNLTYAKTPGDLLTDIQANTYAKWGYEKGVDKNDLIRVTLAYVHAPKVETIAVQEGKKLPYTKAVSIDLTYANVQESWSKSLKHVRTMLEQAQVSDFNWIPPNPNECGAYGGCPYRPRCGLTTSPLAGLGKKNTRSDDMGFADSLSKAGIAVPNGHAGVAVQSSVTPGMATVGSFAPTVPPPQGTLAQPPLTYGLSFLTGAPATAPVAVPAMTQQVAAPVAAAVVAPVLPSGLAFLGGPPPLPPAVVTQQPVAPPYEFSQATQQVPFSFDSILPPDATSRTTPVVMPQAAPVAASMQQPAMTAENLAILTAPPNGLLMPGGGPPQEAPPEGVRRGPGRPRKAKTAAETVAPPGAPSDFGMTVPVDGVILGTMTVSGLRDTSVVIQESSVPSTASAMFVPGPTQTLAAQTPVAPPRFDIFVGCIQVKGGAPVVMFESWIDPILKYICAKHSIVDIRLLQFAQEKAALRAGVLEWIAQNGLPESMIMPSSPLAKDVFEILAPFATSVTRNLGG